jgi:hypothetical protein
MSVSHCQLRNCFSCARCQVLRSFLRKTSIPVSASPGRATAEPLSGTVRPFAENENIVPVPPPAFWLVKLHSVLVGSNPGDSFFLSEAGAEGDAFLSGVAPGIRLDSIRPSVQQSGHDRSG